MLTVCNTTGLSRTCCMRHSCMNPHLLFSFVLAALRQPCQPCLLSRANSHRNRCFAPSLLLRQPCACTAHVEACLLPSFKQQYMVSFSPAPAPSCLHHRTFAEALEKEDHFEYSFTLRDLEQSLSLTHVNDLGAFRAL